MISSLVEIVRDEGRFLAFGGLGPNVARPRYLAYGLAATWLAGIGRYWDHPTAEAWQKLGSGSLAYAIARLIIIYVKLVWDEGRNRRGDWTGTG